MEIVKIDARSLEEYARIPMSYSVTSLLEVIEKQNGSFNLVEHIIKTPYIKDYMKIADQQPQEWMRQFDLSNWGFFFARVNSSTVGAAAIACNTPNVEMLEGRDDLAVLWDIRV